MGHIACSDGHMYVTRDAGAGVLRKECRDCGSVMIDLDAVEDGATVTVPGLFKAAKPTIFSVLRQEQIEDATTERTGPRYAFGGSARPARSGGRHRRYSQN